MFLPGFTRLDGFMERVVSYKGKLSMAGLSMDFNNPLPKPIRDLLHLDI